MSSSRHVPWERRTFRVRGVPNDWNRNRLGSFLTENGYVRPAVQSLANEIHGRSQTATVTFQNVPTQAQEHPADPAKNINLSVPPSDQHSRSRSLTLDTAFLGMTTLYTPPPQDHKVDIVAISGLGGHPFGSFKDRHGEHMWLRDALPYHITGEEDDRPILRVMIYGYSSNLFQSDSFQNLEDLGTAFYPYLRKLAIAGAFKPIVFIAHSLGGLVLKQTLISLYKSIDEEDQKLLRAVCGIGFFGVPHDGMDISSLIPMVENGPNRFLLESIGLFSSQILSIQHREFLETLSAQGDSKIISFYETRMSPTAIKDERGNWKIAGPAAVLVSKSSATHCRENGPQFICAIDRTHSEMVKFGPEDDEYEKVIELIQSLVRDVRRTQESRHPLRQISPEQIQECLQSLAFEHMQTRASDVNDAIPGTCKWLLQHETYTNWIASSHGILWIKGKPGSGKSTLLKSAFSHQNGLSSTTNSTRNSDMFLSFFFHGRGEELQKTPFGLLRSLLHQVLEQAPDALPDLVDNFTQKCQNIGPYQRKWKWHPNDLWSFLELSLPRLLTVRSVWLFVDALDECGETNAKDIIRKFKLLIEKMTTLSTCDRKLRICFSCRHYPILSSPGLLEVCLENENRGDISTYVQSELSSSGEPIPITIADLIIDRASGVFLWAELVVKRVVDLGINGHGPTEIAAAVRSVPESLDELYDELIRNMRSVSLRLIKWVCFATQPLSVSELRWAMAINASYSSLNACQNSDAYVLDDNRMKKQIVKLSHGLAEVTSGPDPIVQFIHQTVKDFFIDKGLSKLIKEIVGDSISPDTAIGMSHLELSKTCIQYLAMEEIRQSTSYEETKLSSDFPFLNYAILQWVAHLKESDHYNIAPEGVLELFDWPANDLLDIASILVKIMYCSDGWAEEWSDEWSFGRIRLEHFAAKHNLWGVMNAILQSGSIATIGLDVKDGCGMTPLACAINNGDEDMCRLLLATRQVDINTKDINDYTPIWYAASNGDKAIVSLLLATKHVDINVENDEGNTPLSSAAELGYEDVVSLLLATGQVDFDTEDNGNLYSLLYAVRDGQEATVKLLLATKQAKMINLMDRRGNTPLSMAVTNGNEAIVKLLLATGQVDINSKNHYRQTLLSLAIKSGNEAIVKHFLATGQAEINSKDKNGWTVLLWAAVNGYKAIIEVLLTKYQVEIDLQDFASRTSLSLAAENGHEAVVKLLLDTGQVDINSKSDYYRRTPLSWAAENGHEAVVKLLLATDQAEINLKDYNGRTALSWATLNGHEAVVRLLLTTSRVNIHTKDFTNRTALSSAAEKGHDGIVKLLLDTGQADINSRDYHHRTALSWAAEKGHEAIVKLLLDTGQVEVDSKDSINRAALSYAAENGHEAIVRLLLDTGQVEIDSEDFYGYTPLSWSRSQAVANLLQQYALYRS